MRQAGTIFSYIKKLNFLLLLPLFLSSCDRPSEVVYKEADFSLVHYGTGQRLHTLFNHFILACPKWENKDGSELAGPNPVYGTVQQWQNICVRAESFQAQSKLISPSDIKTFIKSNFKIVEVKGKGRSMFTGYYSPEIKGNLQQTTEYNTPLYPRPQDMVTANLGLFKPKLKGQRVVGQVKKGMFIPYRTRKEISEFKKYTPLLWLKNPIDKFFLQIQGSGYIELPSGDVKHVGYAAHNGHTYVAIGGFLIENGAIPREEMSMQKIRTWLQDNPGQQEKVFNQNPRYIFFQFGDGKTKGSLGIPLQTKQSLAVDPLYIPLGIPVMVSTTLTASGQVLQKLMVTADTGGAITGPVRGDIYFGHGELAEKYAGHQASGGQLFVLVPR